MINFLKNIFHNHKWEMKKEWKTSKKEQSSIYSIDIRNDTKYYFWLIEENIKQQFICSECGQFKYTTLSSKIDYIL